jgi:hypothetical protein
MTFREKRAMLRSMLAAGVMAAFGLAWVSPVAAQPSALALVPDDAALALVVRNLADLRDKGEAFVKDNNLRLAETERPSHLFRQLFDYLNIKAGLDEKGSAAVVFPNFKKLGFQGLDLMALYCIVFLVPVEDQDQMAANFGFKKGTVKRSQFYTANHPKLGMQVVLYFKGKHLYLGLRKDAVQAVARSNPVTGELSAVQREALANADIAFHFGPQAFGTIWTNAVGQLEQRLRQRDNPVDDQAVKQFGEAARNLRFMVAGLRLEDGLGLDIIASFLKGTGEGVPFLVSLRGGPGATDLNGLPDQNPLFVYAAKGDGVRNVVIARTLIRIFFNETPTLAQVLPAADRRQFLGAFDTMYKHLKGSRAAVYPVADADRARKFGQLAGIVILDLDEPEAHLGRYEEVVAVLNRAAARTSDRPPKFAYHKEAEKLNGRRVDLLTINQPGIRPEEEQRMKSLLGPEWNQLKMVVLEKGVVLLVGSDRGLLLKAVENRLSGAKGLADNKVVAATGAALAPERKLEFFLNLANILALGRDPGKAPPLEALTAFALTIEPDRVQLQIRVPKAEVRPFLELMNLTR